MSLLVLSQRDLLVALSARRACVLSILLMTTLHVSLECLLCSEEHNATQIALIFRLLMEIHVSGESLGTEHFPTNLALILTFAVLNRPVDAFLMSF